MILAETFFGLTFPLLQKMKVLISEPASIVKLVFVSLRQAQITITI